MSGSVLVGVDFSEASRNALDYGAQVAGRMGVALHLVHAWNPTGWQGGAPGDDEVVRQALGRARDHAQVQLDAWAASLDRAGIVVETELADGAASRTLPDIAERIAASLIAVGRHGHASLAHVFLGSVSERVARIAPCPVLIVPPEERRLRLPERMLVGIDFSSGSREAMHVASELSRKLQCERGILLVHAHAEQRVQGSAEKDAAEARYDNRALRKWAGSDFAALPHSEFMTVPGHAEQVLPKAAADLDCDWIVMGVQGRSALASFLLGSTTMRILKLAHRPVLVVPLQVSPDTEGVD